MKSLSAIILFLSFSLCALAQAASTNSNPAQINRTLTINEAISWARQNHPLIAAARQRIAMATGDRLEAGLRPNPSLTFSGENFPLHRPENGFNISRSIDWFATYSQTFETARKRELRVAVAEGDINAAEAEVAAVERQVAYEVKTAFVQALLARSRVTLAREALTHFQQIVNLNEIRVQAGYTAEGDLIKARLETQRASYQARKAVLDYERAKIALLRAMGENTFVTTFDLQGDLDFEPVSVNMTALTEVAMKQPQIRAAEARLERAKAAYQ
ncbi:MAG TPA: TolC family protein, partial [Blastocatellia bacterium]|nr:TolC family protein [Blastocatellia bacterium]